MPAWIDDGSLDVWLWPPSRKVATRDDPCPASEAGASLAARGPCGSPAV